MKLGLENKRVLVTGSSRGIGLSIAKAFLNEGSKTIISARGSDQLSAAEEELKSLYKNKKSLVIAKSCDFTSKESLQSLYDSIKKTWGGLDIVIANVGSGKSVSAILPNDEDWQQTWQTNFESALETSRTFLPMLEESNGSLLFIASITGVEAIGAPVDYSTAKSAVIALSKNMARKLGQKIRVNVVAPGNIMFPNSSWEEKMMINPKEVKRIIESTVPMNRFGLPEEIADAVIFLSSDRAKFITGSILVVDGGQTLGVF